MNRFGPWLTKQRKDREWTQPELASFVGADTSMIVRWEAGDHYPSLPMFARLVRVLCADANQVLRLIPKQDDDAAAA